MLALIAMEPPNTLSANDIRDEKAKVLRAIKPVVGDDCNDCVVRGQYGAGKINDKDVPAYHDEPNVPKDSVTDSFVALKLEIQNWRWAGVPFFVRAGKRMPERVTEVNITFKDVPTRPAGKRERRQAGRAECDYHSGPAQRRHLHAPRSQAPRPENRGAARWI